MLISCQHTLHAYAGCCKAPYFACRQRPAPETQGVFRCAAQCEYLVWVLVLLQLAGSVGGSVVRGLAGLDSWLEGNKLLPALKPLEVPEAVRDEAGELNAECREVSSRRKRLLSVAAATAAAVAATEGNPLSLCRQSCCFLSMRPHCSCWSVRHALFTRRPHCGTLQIL